MRNEENREPCTILSEQSLILWCVYYIMIGESFQPKNICKPASYYVFETPYWCGLRLGEKLALTPADFDFELKIIHVIKSFRRIKGEDIITPPKTEKDIRRVLMPDFYADKMRCYIESLQFNENDRIFPFTKSYTKVDRKSVV
mgnify:CR=1 FL=1